MDSWIIPYLCYVAEEAEMYICRWLVCTLTLV